MRTFCAAFALVPAGACAHEPCQPLARHWGSPDAWRRHELEPRPRCAASDPNCGPEPAVSAEDGCYRPSAARERLPAGEATGRTFACAHDGECQLAGCGNACVAYAARDLVTNCIGYDWLDETAFCGCVEGRCSFFRQ